MGLLGILAALALLIGLAYRGWSVLLLAPASALVAALFAREPLLANWTQTFMGSAAGFVAQIIGVGGLKCFTHGRQYNLPRHGLHG